jgi:trans-aconitate methyltransferase
LTTWDPESYAKHARFVSDLGAPLIDLLDPRPGERVLDLGCGDGALTQALALRGCVVLGVDSSHEQVEATRRLGLPAEQGDGQALQFDEGFDAVFSNAALHWMRPPEPVITGVWRALVPGGRFVAEFGGEGCVTLIRQALGAALGRRGIDAERCCPWFFPSDQQYRLLLEAAGFHVEQIMLFPRPTPLPGEIDGWLEVFAQSYTSAIPAAERPAFLAEVRELLRPQLCDEQGHWTADYVRLRFRGRKPGSDES